MDSCCVDRLATQARILPDVRRAGAPRLSNTAGVYRTLSRGHIVRTAPGRRRPPRRWITMWSRRPAVSASHTERAALNDDRHSRRKASRTALRYPLPGSSGFVRGALDDERFAAGECPPPDSDRPSGVLLSPGVDRCLSRAMSAQHALGRDVDGLVHSTGSSHSWILVQCRVHSNGARHVAQRLVSDLCRVGTATVGRARASRLRPRCSRNPLVRRARAETCRWR